MPKNINRKVSNKKKLSNKKSKSRAKSSTKVNKSNNKSIATAFVEMTGGNPFIVKYNNLEIKGGKKRSAKKSLRKKKSVKKGGSKRGRK